MKRLIPWLLVMSRIGLAPVAIWLAIAHVSNLVWMGQFAFAALSDWLDGKLARQWGTATAGLRQADSIADTVYVLAVALGLWFSHPTIVHAHRWGIALVITLELLRYPLDWWRFGRGASYHAWSAKVFGVSLLVAVSTIMLSGHAGPFLWIALLIGVVSELEGMWISLVLPVWTHDVKGIKTAFEIRARAQRRDRLCSVDLYRIHRVRGRLSLAGRRRCNASNHQRLDARDLDASGKQHIPP
jgi:phosphatidylglycerophosphate synthase